MPGEIYNLYVSLFGKFSIQLLDGANNDVKSSANHLRQHIFLQYLCVFHDRPVSQEELIEAIWDANTEIGDPVNNLKTTLYRTRQLLEDLGVKNAKNILIYRRGASTPGRRRRTLSWTWRNLTGSMINFTSPPSSIRRWIPLWRRWRFLRMNF